LGSWNETCSLTNLPVMHGEDVYVLFLQETQQTVESNCYPMKYWTLLPFIFEAKYDDCGRFTDEKGALIPFILQEFKENLYELEEGENSCHDIPVKVENFGMNLLNHANEEERLFLQPGYFKHKDKVAVRRIFIKKSAMTDFLAEYVYDQHYSWRSKKKLKYAEMVDLLYNAIKDKRYRSLGSSVNLHCITFENDVGLPYDLFKAYAGHTAVVQPGVFFEKFIPLEDSFRTRYNVVTPHPEHFREAVEANCMLLFLNNFFDATRQMWTPQTSGSQDTETNAHRLRAKLIRNACTQVNKWYKDV